MEAGLGSRHLDTEEQAIGGNRITPMRRTRRCRAWAASSRDALEASHPAAWISITIWARGTADGTEGKSITVVRPFGWAEGSMAKGMKLTTEEAPGRSRAVR